MPHTVFALLDDAADNTADDAPPRSRLYSDYSHTLHCADPQTLDAFWNTVEAAQAQGLHALLLADYAFGVRLAGAAAPDDRRGSLRVLLFRACRQCNAIEVEDFLAQREGAATPGVCAVQDIAFSADEPAFAQALARIHAAIRDGQTYQVNYSLRLRARAGGDPLALYRHLRQRQPVPFGALIALPPGEAISHILSLSPELFVRHHAGELRARPMKGTAPRGADPASDRLAREQLNNAKNRAENLMIVDLLRNDLGRIACTGSVHVPALFEIEAHPTLWQMTSSVSAQRRPETGFADVLRALFPCGSITGAPKRRTMQLIDALEDDERGLYCGAIGWVDAPAHGQRCGDFCLSVPIRTLTLGTPVAGFRPLFMGLGAGIVADSVARDEYAECLLKGRFLTSLDGGFALIETLYADAHGPRHVQRHLARLAHSAEAFGIACAPENVAAALHAALTPPPPRPSRVRLLLRADGRIEISSAALEALPAGPVRLRLASEPIDTDAWPLAHKSTLRAPYDAALREAQAQGLFDIIHSNLRGEITEGARSNLFARIDGHWFTPPLACGVLPGIVRAIALADPALAARERILTRNDLLRAEQLVVCNALRGMLSAILLD